MSNLIRTVKSSKLVGTDSDKVFDWKNPRKGIGTQLKTTLSLKNTRTKLRHWFKNGQN